MKILYCTCGKHILVDDDIYPILAKKTWRCNGGPADSVTTSVPIGGGKYTKVAISKFLFDVPDSYEVDHIDRDSHHNCRSNLRLATKSQNKANRGKFRNNTSGKRGVYLDKRNNKYCAQITINGKPTWIGQFTNIDDAARAYDKRAIEVFGEFATTNFPRTDYTQNTH